MRERCLKLHRGLRKNALMLWQEQQSDCQRLPLSRLGRAVRRHTQLTLEVLNASEEALCPEDTLAEHRRHNEGDAPGNLVTVLLSFLIFRCGGQCALRLRVSMGKRFCGIWWVSVSFKILSRSF